MRIGIDISQIAFEGTGVARYVENMVATMIGMKTDHTFILFGSSLRRFHILKKFCIRMKLKTKNMQYILLPVPPSILHVVWNILHIIPVEWMIGRVNVYWSSDWIQPPLRYARGITTIHDVSFLLYPESFDRKIISVQKQRIKRAIHECDQFLCDSYVTKKDCMQHLHISEKKLSVIYPGIEIH